MTDRSDSDTPNDDQQKDFTTDSAYKHFLKKMRPAKKREIIDMDQTVI